MKSVAINPSLCEQTSAMNSSPIPDCQKLILAESQPIIFQPLLSQLKKIVPWVSLCCSYEELIEKCSENQPNILILGTLPNVNCLEIYRKCRSHWHNLPIILLANQPVVNDYFKNWAMKQGVSNVVSSYPQEFVHLRAAIEEICQQRSKIDLDQDFFPLPPLAETTFLFMELGEAIRALNSLSEYSQRYFGPLAIGNYWKKAHNQALEAHPWLQEWSVDYQGKITYLSALPLPSDSITTEQFKSLQTWTKEFLKECQRVVVDFPKMIKNKHISPEINQLIS